MIFPCYLVHIEYYFIKYLLNVLVQQTLRNKLFPADILRLKFKFEINVTLSRCGWKNPFGTCGPE